MNGHPIRRFAMARQEASEKARAAKAKKEAAA